MCDQTVGQVMSPRVVTARTTDSLETVTSSMREHGVSGCPVVDGLGHLVGVISEVDLARVLSLRKGVGSLSGFLEALLQTTANETLDPLQVLLHRFRHMRVSSCMSSPAIVVSAHDSIQSAAKLMEVHHVNRLPVVEGERIVGMLARSDIVAAVSHHLGNPSHALAPAMVTEASS